MNTILVIEDDNFIADIYKTKLAREEFSVILAHDGEEALNLLRQSRPDLIILDMLMPKKNGIEVLKQISSKPEYQNIPLIVASNLENSDLISQAKKLGAKEFLIKSDISVNKLVDICKSYLPSSTHA